MSRPGEQDQQANDGRLIIPRPGPGSYGSAASANPIPSMLHADEQLMWSGQPDVRAYVLRGAWFVIPFSLLWGGFAIFWEASVVTTGAPPLFWLWGVPFVLIGLYMIFGRWFVARREAQQTFYALTDRRILIVSGVWRRQVTELRVRSLPLVRLELGRGGIGTVALSQGSPFAFRPPPGWPTMGMYQGPTELSSINDAARVYQQINDIRDSM